MGSDTDTKRRPPELLNASKEILPYLHTLGEIANLEDNHSFWAYLEDLTEAINKSDGK